MSGREQALAVQRDWENREFTEMVQLNVLKIVEFLNKFDVSTRYRLAAINEKLTTLERKCEYLAAALDIREGGGVDD